MRLGSFLLSLGKTLTEVLQKTETFITGKEPWTKKQIISIELTDMNKLVLASHATSARAPMI